MTLGIGWVDDSNSYLVADSAITYRSGGFPRADRSTFDEEHDDGADRVEESAVKTISLTGTVAAIYAGMQTPAIGFLKFVRQELLKGGGLAHILNTVGGSERFDFKALFGEVGANGPRLYLFESTTRRVTEFYAPNEPVVIGSLPREGVALVKQLPIGLYEPAMGDFAVDKDRVLATVLAALQATAQRTAMLRNHAGGAFFGIRIDECGVHLQPDVWYVLYRDVELRSSSPITHHVLTGMRSNLAFAWSGLENKYSVFVTDVRPMNDGEIEAAVGEYFKEPPKPKADYYVLIERTKGALVGIESRGKPPRRYLVVNEAEAGPTITLSDELVRDLDRIRDCDPANVPLIIRSE